MGIKFLFFNRIFYFAKKMFFFFKFSFLNFILKHHYDF